MPDSFPNRFARRPGRGFRPWLLLPKVLAFALFFGSLAAALALFLPLRFLSPTDPRRLWALNAVGHLFTGLIVPALLVALALGLALLLQHPRLFLRMRWLQLKLLILALMLPSAHLLLSSRLALLRSAFNQQTLDPRAQFQFTAGLAGVLLITALIILLARLKPRLAQNWAQSYPAPLPPRS